MDRGVWQATVHEVAVSNRTKRLTLYFIYICVHVCVCVCARACAWVCACVCICVLSGSVVTNYL